MLNTIQKKSQNNKKLFFLCMEQFFPDAKGGAELSSLTLFNELKKNGWEIMILCKGLQKMESLNRKQDLEVLDFTYSIDFISGFPCVRYPKNIKLKELEELFKSQLKEFKPTYVVGEIFDFNIERCFKLLKKASDIDFKTFCFVRIIEGVKALQNNIKPPEKTVLLANSVFTAKELYAVFRKKAEVVNPFIDLKKIIAPTKNPKYITFINPIEVKGVVTAIEIAEKMPEQDFLFVTGGWDKTMYTDINPMITKIRSIKNIKFIEYQKNMKEVYNETKILLVPSHFEETFGRVILEAQANSIPVIGSNRGNIPYTLGKGGFIIDDYKNADAYIEKINILLNDKSAYKKYSEEAHKQSSKEEFRLDFQVKKFISILEKEKGVELSK